MATDTADFFTGAGGEPLLHAGLNIPVNELPPDQSGCTHCGHHWSAAMFFMPSRRGMAYTVRGAMLTFCEDCGTIGFGMMVEDPAKKAAVERELRQMLDATMPEELRAVIEGQEGGRGRRT